MYVVRYARRDMCGRYILAQLAAAERAFKLATSQWHFSASFNIAPTQSVPVVRAREGVREGLLMRWGLIPFFAHGVPPKYSTINARIETLPSAPSYRTPWKRGQRCIMPASGFYEWHSPSEGARQPYYIHLADQEVFGFAALWDRSVREDGSALESCAIVTMPANALLKQIHNGRERMPAILRVEDHAAWLSAAPEEALRLLAPYPAELMVAYRVSPRVNSPRNNDPRLIEALA